MQLERIQCLRPGIPKTFQTSLSVLVPPCKKPDILLNKLVYCFFVTCFIESQNQPNTNTIQESVAPKSGIDLLLSFHKYNPKLLKATRLQKEYTALTSMPLLLHFSCGLTSSLPALDNLNLMHNLYCSHFIYEMKNDNTFLQMLLVAAHNSVARGMSLCSLI